MNARSKPYVVVLISALFWLVVATLAVAADPVIHIVQKGETLYAIARQYDISVESLKKVNAIVDEGRLFVGLKLTIPGSRTAPALAPPAAVPDTPMLEYVVAKGDTLYSIAKAHGVSVDSIVKASGMKTTTIKLGQKLKVPARPSGVSVAVSGAEAAGTKPPASSTPVPAESTSKAAKSWPANGPVSYLQGKLKGVSIATEPSSAILALRAGTVISAGPFRGFDLVAFVQSSDGLVYVYGGAGVLSVRVGDSVRKGSLLGKVASDGASTAYFFVFKGADTIDPNSVPRD
jgi:LysM repeat protein